MHLNAWHVDLWRAFLDHLLGDSEESGFNTRYWISHLLLKGHIYNQPADEMQSDALSCLQQQYQLRVSEWLRCYNHPQS